MTINVPQGQVGTQYRFGEILPTPTPTPTVTPPPAPTPDAVTPPVASKYFFIGQSWLDI
jgi:hypothetical protein